MSAAARPVIDRLQFQVCSRPAVYGRTLIVRPWPAKNPLDLHQDKRVIRKRLGAYVSARMKTLMAITQQQQPERPEVRSCPPYLDCEAE